MSAKTGTYEKDMDKLKGIIEKLSTSGISLDEMMKLYEEGVALSEKCRKALDGYEAKLTEIENRSAHREAADE